VVEDDYECSHFFSIKHHKPSFSIALLDLVDIYRPHTVATAWPEETKAIVVWSSHLLIFCLVKMTYEHPSCPHLFTPEQYAKIRISLPLNIQMQIFPSP